jgi:hypothetical protein
MFGDVRVLVIMDPIESIKPAKDSTLAMLLAAASAAIGRSSTPSRRTCGCATASPTDAPPSCGVRR